MRNKAKPAAPTARASKWRSPNREREPRSQHTIQTPDLPREAACSRTFAASESDTVGARTASTRRVICAWHPANPAAVEFRKTKLPPRIVRPLQELPQPGSASLPTLQKQRPRPAPTAV